jgi:hypothetical protein
MGCSPVATMARGLEAVLAVVIGAAFLIILAGIALLVACLWAYPGRLPHRG